MLSYVTQDEGKDRADREMVAPWFKFLWESFRAMLEILRNNAKLEALYAMVANRALQFCLSYQRSTEFRRLCDILRNHLKNLDQPQRSKQMRMVDMPDLTKPDTCRRYLETRFEQLRVAAELGMWQEAFRSIEDIFNLIAISQKSGGRPPRPELMATYYMRMTQIFRMSGSMLYLGFAWFKLFSLYSLHLKTLSEQDQATMVRPSPLSARPPCATRPSPHPKATPPRSFSPPPLPLPIRRRPRSSSRRCPSCPSTGTSRRAPRTLRWSRIAWSAWPTSSACPTSATTSLRLSPAARW